MKYKALQVAAIFFMTNFNRDREGMAPWHHTGSDPGKYNCTLRFQKTRHPNKLDTV